jgi:hypothetical protein
MSDVQAAASAPCRFRGEHPTVVRPASRLPLVRSVRGHAGALCAATPRGLRASNRPRLRDTRYRRAASKNWPSRRTS